jgi:glutamate-1-semialdehyde 2,1-aminomutase/spore coat polysaccharide biosynthesis protein SpsF
MKTVAIAQARMGSTRLPGKVMKDLGGKPLLRWTIDALRQVPSIDQVVLATSTLDADDEIANYCLFSGIPFFRGSESDVLDRFYQAAKFYQASTVLRFTCDCCFIDPHIVEQVIKLRQVTDADYASNCYPATFPDGLDTECFRFSALKAAWKEADSSVDRDCLTQFIVRNGSRFKAVNLTNPIPGGDREHWVCDSADDFAFCSQVAARLKRNGPPHYTEILDILDKEPGLRNINRLSIRNERFYDALAEERLPARTFERSRRVFERASKVIPTGANTFSKSHLQFPAEGSPLYASHGDGAYIFDVDGNRYVDLVNALLPVVLGYRDPDVDFAVRQQLDHGVILSLATELEVELAETLCRLIPCAEMVKFGKTGTDVMTAAVRLARAYTGRDHVLLSGYHGWADWSMSCTDRHSGIPENARKLSHKIPYGDECLAATHFLPESSLAAIVAEPVDDPDYLQHVRDYCTKFGIILIFDEIRTGFRYDMGGAQTLYGVTPDLACFGKAMANGMPISALAGKREIMSRMETPDVYYSGTFFGETLSIAAALATIKKLEAENVIAYLCQIGARLEYEILKLRQKYDLTDFISLSGWYSNQSIVFKGPMADRLRSLFMTTMFQQGVLIINSNNLSYAMREPELRRIMTAYECTFAILSRALRTGTIAEVKPTAAAPLRVVA